MSETSIAIMEKAAVLLASANTIQEVKEFKSIAISANVYARQKGLGKEAESKCLQYVRRAELKIGDMLKATEEHRAKGTRGQLKGAQGGRIQSGGTPVVLPDENGTPTLADLGLTKKEASLCMAVAQLTEEKRQDYVNLTLKPTEARRQQRREAVRKKIGALPHGKFRVIYADPPWKYNDARQTGDHWETTAAEEHYPTMTFEELAALDIRTLAADDAVLFMWATFPLLPEQLKTLAAWGFKYKTAFVWSKGRGTFGHYHNASAELLIVATRGSCVQDSDTREDQVQTYKPARHSSKPIQWRAMIDRMYPEGPRIELFARGGIPAPWVAWGSDAEE